MYFATKIHDIDGATVSLLSDYLIKKILQKTLEVPEIEPGPTRWKAGMHPQTYHGLVIETTNVLSIQRSHV